MNKEEFMAQLSDKIIDLPKQEYTAILSYYQETIDDAIEDGMQENEAIDNLEEIDVIVKQIHDEHLDTNTKDQTAVKKDVTNIYRKIGFIALSPFIFSGVLLIFTLCLTLICLFLIPCSLLLGVSLAAVLCMLGTPIFMFSNFLKAITLFGVSLALAGSSIYLYYACVYCYEKLKTLLRTIMHTTKSTLVKGWDH